MARPLPDLTAPGDKRRAHVSALAVLSVMAGLLSLCPVMALAAVVLGLWGRRAIALSEGRLRGVWPATIGIGLGVIGAGVTVIAVLDFAPVYRAVTPVAREFLTTAGNGRYDDTYDLFSAEYRATTVLQSHKDMVDRLMNEGQAGELTSLRWAWRLVPQPGLQSVRVTYDARFRNARHRITFEFVPSGETWAIRDVALED